MRFPNESLEDYKARKLKPLDPPARATLEFTGESETLKPLAYWQGPSNRKSSLDESFWHSIFAQLSWFHRSLAMSGVLTVLTFLIGTGLYLAIYGPPVDTTHDLSQIVVSPNELVSNNDSDQPLTTDDPNANDVSLNEQSPDTLDQPSAVRTGIKHKRVRRVQFAANRPRVVVASYRPLRQWLHPPFWVSEFVPTNQAISVENGVIRIRIEPQSSNGFKKIGLPN